MKTKISSDVLKKGMYVILPDDFSLADFSSNSFMIETSFQLKVLTNSLKGRDVVIDLSKSWVSKNVVDTLSHRPNENADPWNAEKVVSTSFKSIIKNGSPSEKALAIHNESTKILYKLMKNPNTSALVSSTEEIKDVVDVILDHNDVNSHLIAITKHDFYTYTHSVNVGILGTMLLGKIFGSNSSLDLKAIATGYFLHDLGKTKIPAEIINKPARLTEEEMKVIKRHPYQGYKMFKAAGLNSPEIESVIMQHHERDDGNGYPRGLMGDEITSFGKIGVITDVFDALTAERSYKPSLTSFEALQIMKENMLSHFDKDIFSVFVHLLHGS